MKGEPGDPPDLRPGQRLPVGAVSDLSRRIPTEITGANGVRVKQHGKRVIVEGPRVRRSVSGGGLSVTEVTELPAIPTSGAKIVFWKSTGGGTGDDQLWIAYAGQSAWTPMQFLTSKSGTP